MIGLRTARVLVVDDNAAEAMPIIHALGKLGIGCVYVAGDKLAPALHKLMEEDLMLRLYRDPQTNEFLLAGAGQLHIEAVVSSGPAISSASASAQTTQRANS